MPIDDIGVGFFGAIFRFFGWIFLEVFLEILIKGLGHTLCKPFKKVDIDSFSAFIVGLIAWVIIMVLTITTYSWLSKNPDIDSCLERGGLYNNKINVCEFKQQPNQ